MPENLAIISRHEARVVNELLLEIDTLNDTADEKAFEPPTDQPPIGFSSADEMKVSSLLLLLLEQKGGGA